MIRTVNLYSPTVVCIHGAGGGGWEWNIWRRVFEASGWRVIAADLQPVPAGIAATRIEDYCAQVASCCAALAGAPHVIVGASLGGLLALHQASRLLPSGLVLVNPVPPAGLAEAALAQRPQSVIAWSRSTLSSTLRAMPDADAAACWYAWRRWRDESGTVVDAARAGFSSQIPRCPALVLASVADEEVPIAASRSLATTLQAHCIELDNASHVGPLLGRDAATHAQRVERWARAILDASATPTPAERQTRILRN